MPATRLVDLMNYIVEGGRVYDSEIGRTDRTGDPRWRGT